MWTLREFVSRYLALAVAFGNALPLSKFGLSDEQTIKLFVSFDDDYHISRYFHFSKQEGKSYQIGAEEITHVSLDAAIDEIL